MIRIHGCGRYVLPALLIAAGVCVAQNAAQPGNQPAPAVPSAPGHLTAEEKAQYDLAAREFAADNFADALPLYKSLLAAHPADPTLSKFAAESAINTGDESYAIALLEPMAQRDANDWQAVALLARAFAESGDKARRDAEMQRMAVLYQSGAIPIRVQQYLIEKAQVDGKVVRIWHSLQPWGRFHVYDYARVSDSSGNLIFRITLESSDIDQPLFAQQHPAEAAKGIRLFSIDGYSEGPVHANGMHTATHATYDMVMGQPDYDTVRTAFLGIAAGQYVRLATSIFQAQPPAR